MGGRQSTDSRVGSHRFGQITPKREVMSSKPVRSKQGFSGGFPSQDTGEVGFFNGNSRNFEHDHVQPQARTRQASMRPPSKVRRNTVQSVGNGADQEYVDSKTTTLTSITTQACDQS